MARDMIKVVHGFVTEQGDLLPRWREAFPAARALKLGRTVGEAAPAPQLVWVRLVKSIPPTRLLESVRREFGNVSIIALADQPGDEEALACFSAGARGYCNTHAVPALLRNVADVVLQGGLWIGESLMRRLLQGTAHIAMPAPKGAPADWAALLTARERQVALAVAEGASNKEIARRLNITERTIKAHTSAIFGKLNVRDRLQLSLIVHGRQVH
jgi:two-component system, NarL family, nitrate/nitrite response regulator NarL